MQVLRSRFRLGDIVPNIGTMLLDNAVRYGAALAFAERAGGPYRYWSWPEFGEDLLRVAAWLLRDQQAVGPAAGGRIAFVAGNSYTRYVAELATMAAGLVTVPVFPGYPADLTGRLLAFSDADLVVTDQPDRVLALDPDARPRRVLALTEPDVAVLAAFVAGGGCLYRYGDVVQARLAAEERARVEATLRGVEPARLAVIMYTSGTSGFPKGVQLSHRNLMSQQQALAACWRPEPGLRLLSYLPWHHSFGGLFERFFAAYFGGCLAVDDSLGKDVDRLLVNFAEIRPQVFFSVPKVYQEIVARVQNSRAVEATFFHPELRFVFTAAAPLPISTSNVFRDHGVPVVEGWGLTETSPGCTLTELELERTPGVVGWPMAGVEVALADDGEILVRGSNVMSGYFRNEEATREVFTADGWFRTGDLGEFGPEGVRILSRKERMFKLSNGEKVFPAQIEQRIHSRCQFVKYAYVFGSGLRAPCMLVFPNQQLFEGASGAGGGKDCARPADAAGLSRCLSECVATINKDQSARFEAVRRALVIGRELTIENNELTPSFKLIPRRIEERYADCIRAMQEDRYDELPADVLPLTLGETR